MKQNNDIDEELDEEEEESEEDEEDEETSAELWDRIQTERAKQQREYDRVNDEAYELWRRANREDL